jgi:DNA invertase Pin-like site-specific DNA recombinase
MNATTKRAVTIIPARAHLPQNTVATAALKRVAAYARVSTDDEEQITSYDAQVAFYEKHIKANPAWTFVAVYTDSGISGTSTKRRDGFNQMVADALAGKIDLILTKSVSRFARNTVDTLTTVRKLKEKGVEVFFEKENIYTLDSKGELLITIMSSLAQEESRSISENVTWGVRRRFEAGKVSMAYKHFLGYEKGPDGLPAIVEDEANIVRLIYRLFIYGKSPNCIASMLAEAGIASPGGKEIWRPNGIISSLTNEKYSGAALLQKGFTVDFLTKKRKVNEGEIPQYFVENSHPAIVAPEIFDLAKYELARRQAEGRMSSSGHPFSGKLFCGECSAAYGSKVWHSRDEYRRMIWRCNAKYGKGAHAKTPHLTDSQIEAAFIAAFNKRLESKAEIFEVYNEVVQALTDTGDLDREAAELLNERDVVTALTRQSIQENASKALNQADYEQRIAGLQQRYDVVVAKLVDVENRRLERNAKRMNITRFLKMLVKQGDDLVTEFDEELWYITVDTITVFADGRMVVRFRDGVVVTIGPEVWRKA